MIAKTSNGNAIPIPNTMKLRRLVKKSIVDALIANSTISEAGLQGKTIAPKNNPKTKEVNKGFLRIGACHFGINFPKSTSNISNTLTIASIPKAIGDMRPMALVNDSCNNKVKINPNIIILSHICV
jgi:hypothetical protein